MMDELLGEFENLKISALSKSKSINKYVNNVTIGPNSTYVQIDNHTTPHKNNNENKVKIKSSIPNNSDNKHTSLGKILTEYEAEIKEEIASSVRSRLEKIQDASRALNARVKSQWLQKQKMLIAQSQEQEELMSKVLEEHDRKAVDHLQQLQVQQQKQIEERNKRNLELQTREKFRRELILIFESIQKQQLSFRVHYQDIALLIKENHAMVQDPKKHATFSGVSSKLKSLLENMEKIKEVCKAQSVEIDKLTNEQISHNNSIAKANLEVAIILVAEAAKLKESLQQFISICKENEKRDKQKAEAEQVYQAQEQSKLAISTVDNNPNANVSSKISASNNSAVSQQPEQKNNEIKETIKSSSVISLDSFANKNSLKEYANLQQFLESYKKNFENLVNDSSMKQFRFACQKAVNIPLNAISTVSSQHMLDKYTRLANLLRGVSVEAGGSTVTSSHHPQGIAFCTDLLARKFVLQGDLLISSNPDSAHGYAAVLCALAHDFPDFAKLILAYFFLTSPYLVPFYPPRVQGQTDREYYESLGYNYSDDGVVEKQDKFLKRMAGTMRLYAAYMCARLKRGQNGPHPHGLKQGWMWLANVLNIEPRSDITAALLFEFLEVTGSSMQSAYRNQFQKILAYINNIYLDKMQKIDSGGPVSRMSVFLQKVKKANGIIEPPKGRLSENFW